MSWKIKSVPGIFIFILLASFLLCHILLAFYSRYTSDDYYFMVMVKKMGILGFAKWIYYNNEGCIAALFYQGLLTKGMLFFHKPFILLLSFSLISIYCLHHFFKTVLYAFLGEANFLTCFLLALQSYIGVYMTNLAVGEGFYWCIGGFYMVGSCLFLYCLSVFVSTQKQSYRIICLIAFFLFGMSRLNYAFIGTATIGLLGLYHWVKKGKLEFKYVWALLFILSGIVIYILGPGNYIRRGGGGIPGMGPVLAGLKHTFLHFFSAKIRKIPVYLIFIAPAYVVGQINSASIQKLYKSKREFWTIQALLLILLLLLLLVNSAIMSVINGGIFSDRTILLLDMIFIILLLNGMIHAGSFFPKLFSKAYLMPVLLLLASSLCLLRFYKFHTGARDQALSDDRRTEFIQAALRESETHPIDTLVLAPLLKCDLLYNWDVYKLKKKDTLTGLNNRLTLYYSTPFRIDSGGLNQVKYRK